MPPGSKTGPAFLNHSVKLHSQMVKCTLRFKRALRAYLIKDYGTPITDGKLHTLMINITKQQLINFSILVVSFTGVVWSHHTMCSLVWGSDKTKQQLQRRLKPNGLSGQSISRFLQQEANNVIATPLDSIHIANPICWLTR